MKQQLKSSLKTLLKLRKRWDKIVKGKSKFPTVTELQIKYEAESKVIYIKWLISELNRIINK